MWNGNGSSPGFGGRPKSSSVFPFGVAVKAKKERLGCRPRDAITSAIAVFVVLLLLGLALLNERGLLQVLRRENLPDLSGGLARLRAVRLIRDDGVPAVRKLANLLGHEGERLQGGDDDRGAPLESFGELRRLHTALAHAHNDALLVLDLVDRVLELLVEHLPIGDDHHRVEDLLVGLVVQTGQAVSEPGYGVRLAATRRVLDQVVVAGALSPRSRLQPPDRVELVVAGKEHQLLCDLLPRLPPLLLLQVHEAADDVHEAVPLEYLLPEVGGSVPRRVIRIPLASVAATVEGKEVRSLTGELRRHVRQLVVQCEVDQGAGAEAEDREARVATFVLGDRVPDVLVRQLVLEFDVTTGSPFRKRTRSMESSPSGRNFSCRTTTRRFFA